MAKTPPTPRELIHRLGARHDDLIHRLDELNAQIERALADVLRTRSVQGTAAEPMLREVGTSKPAA